MRSCPLTQILLCSHRLLSIGFCFPVYISVLEPLDAVGLLKGSMVHCLAALRRHKHVLLNTMHIYLKVRRYRYIWK